MRLSNKILIAMLVLSMTLLSMNMVSATLSTATDSGATASQSITGAIRGITIKTSTGLIVNATEWPQCTAPYLDIQNSSGSNISRFNFVNGVATININISSGTYLLGASNDSNTYTNYYLGSGGAYPFVGTNGGLLNITADYTGGTSVACIQSVTYSTGGVIVTLLAPPNNSFSKSNVTFNASVLTGYSLVNATLYTNLSGTWQANQTVSLTGYANNSIFTINNIPDQQFIWNVYACDNQNNCNYSTSNYTINVFTQKPILTILYPNSTSPIAYGYEGKNVSLNYSIFDNDGTLTCWYNYNQSQNISTSCVANSSLILGTYNQYNLTLYANDTAGNVGNASVSWSYLMYELNQSFNSLTSITSAQTYLITLIYSPSTFSSIVPYIYYNNTPYLGSLNNSGTINGYNYYVYQATLNTPSQSANYSYYWNFTTTDTNNVVRYLTSQNNTQQVTSFTMDNCTTGPNLLFNYTLYDQDSLLPMNGTMEVIVNLYATDGITLIQTFNRSYTQTSNARVCITNISSPYLANYQVKFYGNTTYSVEYMNGQQISISSPIKTNNVGLYDIVTGEVFPYTLTFRDSTLALFPGVLVQVQRQYIPQNVFTTVEAPVTDSNGQAVLHLESGTSEYNLIFTLNNEPIATFNKIVPSCYSLPCTFNLNQLASTAVLSSIQSSNNLNYQFSYSNSSNTIQLNYNTVDGTTQNITLVTTVVDAYFNNTICSTSQIASSGAITCTVPTPIINSTVVSQLYINGVQIDTYYKNTGPSSSQIFGGTRVILAMLMYCTLTLMFISSPIAIIVGAIMGIVFASIFGLVDGGSLLGTSSIVLWFIIAGTIIIWQINKARTY